MITLLTRKEIVDKHKIICSELAKLQKGFHNEDTLQYYKDENEEHLYWEQFDLFDGAIISYETYNKIIGLGHPDIETFTPLLTKKLKALLEITGANQFIVVSHLKLDFFGNRNNKFKPLVNAYKLLEKIVGKDSYKEAFLFDLESLPSFVEILFWITRCDPIVAEYVFIFDDDEKLQLNICKYGNLHLTEFDKENLSEDLLKSLGWQIIEGQEFDQFSTQGKIQGRNFDI